MNRIAKVMVSLTCAALLWSCEEDYQEVKTWEDLRVESIDNANLRYQQMIDSAMLQDRSLADIHFHPGSTQLNSLGQQYVKRFGELLGNEGGILYLESSSTNPEFNMARMQSVMDYLASSGFAADRIDITTGLAQSGTMTAVEAIEVKDVQFDPNRPDLTDIISGGTGGEFGTE